MLAFEPKASHFSAFDAERDAPCDTFAHVRLGLPAVSPRRRIVVDERRVLRPRVLPVGFAAG
jgi:hypothetical protein